jgi:preprotein translocase SecE subunit
VNWPSRQDVWSTTVVVVITVAFFGAFFAITDGILVRLYTWLNAYMRSH